MTPVEFLRRFHGPAAIWTLTAIDPDGAAAKAAGEKPPSTIETRSFRNDEPGAAAFIEKWNGKRNLYHSVGQARKLVSKKTSKIDMATTQWLHVDLDAEKGETVEQALTRISSLVEQQNAAGLIPFPTVSVLSGGGRQLFWRLAEPTEDLKRVERINKRLAVLLGGDSCHNCDRIMRVPGTINLPNEKKRERGRVKTEARLESWAEQNVFTLDQLDEPAPLSAVTRGATAKRLDSIDDLDRWGVPNRVKVICVQGRDPDNPKADDDSWSAWLFDAVCQLVRCSVPDEVIFSVITDPDFGISESVLDKPNPTKYAEKQIKSATEATERDPVVLSDMNPSHSAREFCRRVDPHLLLIAEDWLTFDGIYYPTVEDGMIRSQVHAFLEAAMTRIKDGRLIPFWPTAAKKNNVRDALADIVRRPKDQFEPPCWIRGDGPPALEILACQNGLLHLPSGQLREPTPDFFTRNALAFAYDPAAPEPKGWLAFLDSNWKNDPEKIALLQEYMGYELLPDTSLQKILLMIGPTRSGKGTIAETMRELVGRVNTCSPSAGSLAGDFGREPLLNKTLAIMSDVRVGTRTNKASLIETLLAVSGEDAVTVNRKYKRAWDGHLKTRFVIMTNDLPDLPDTSGALANRFLPLVMTRSFLGKEDHGLKGRIHSELPGILLWAIEGWKRLHARGHFELPTTARETVLDLAEVGMPVARFLRDKCVREDAARIEKDALFAAWTSWRFEEGVLDGPEGKNAFSRDLRSLGIRAVRESTDGTRKQFYAGVRIEDHDRDMPF